MKFVVGRRGIEIIPQDDQDIAYIEDTLGLKNKHDALPLVRENAMGMSCLAKLTTHPFPAPKEIAYPAHFDVEHELKEMEKESEKDVQSDPEVKADGNADVVITKMKPTAKCIGLMTAKQAEYCKEAGLEPSSCCEHAGDKHSPKNLAFTCPGNCSCHD